MDSSCTKVPLQIPYCVGGLDLRMLNTIKHNVCIKLDMAEKQQISVAFLWDNVTRLVEDAAEFQ